MKENEQKINDAVLYKILRPIITVLFKILFIPKIKGKENIPNSGRIILAGTHTNNLDSLLLISSTKRNIHFLAKKELWNGLKKIIFSNMGLIQVDRSKKNPNALKDAYEYLKNEKVIGIFPEGTTQKGRGLLPFKLGAVKMANKTNTKIVPFVIKGKYRPFINDLEIEFLKPIKIDENLEEENERLRNIIKKRIGD